MFLSHRGISKHFPENTLGSITETFNNSKYSGIEFDIQLTKDKKWILFHDDDMKRLCGTDKKINETNYDQLDRIKWKGKEFPVNRLSDLTNFEFYKKFTLNVEIKSRFEETNDEIRNDLIDTLNLINTNIFISSFDHSWYSWITYNSRYEFACISDTILPTEGNFWVLHDTLFENIDLLDLLERNVKIISYGKMFNEEPFDESCPLIYQIIDEREGKYIYIDGIFEIITYEYIKIFRMAKDLGVKLIVGVLDSHSNNNMPIFKIEERIEVLKNIKLIDKVLKAPSKLNREFLQNNEIDIVVNSTNDIEYYKDAFDMNLILK